MVLGLRIVPRAGLVVLILTPGLVLVILARRVYLGRRGASRMSLAMVVPMMAAVAVVSATLACYALVYGLGRGAERAALWWLLAIPPGVLVILILKDLVAYLLWISRVPMADKPKVAFMPRKK